tara:strand:+ start:25282 stop:25704 length:423 start_codon:yes stop_codon:yes gene_type:complete
MKLSNKLISIGIISILAGTGCTSTGTKSHFKEEFKEALGQTQDDWGERKSEFIDKSEARLDDIANDLFAMKKSNSKIEKIKQEDAKAHVDSSIDQLTSIRHELADLRRVEAKDWQNEKNSFLSKMNVLESEFTKARSYYY